MSELEEILADAQHRRWAQRLDAVRGSLGAEPHCDDEEEGEQYGPRVCKHLRQYTAMATLDQDDHRER
jgi:hypothetical protein